MRRLRLSLPLLLVCLVFPPLSGCGDDDGPDEATAATTESSAAATVMVSGRVILGGAGGLQSPLDGVTLTFAPPAEDPEVIAETDDLGRYSLEVPPGEYDVTLGGLADGQSADPLHVTVPADESFQLPVIRVRSS